MQVCSLVTDNAANMSKMRSNLEQHETTKLITYGCSAHLMYLLAKDFSVPEIKSNVEIAKCFHSNHFAASALKIMDGTKLMLPQDVRWNSVVDCFEQYIKNTYSDCHYVILVCLLSSPRLIFAGRCLLASTFVILSP
ncbi:hypothetical protein E2320_010814 [Naja naja]|nr:hypothetical protein E2320_010814 [Naja naja]